jgi:hypothetical protein
VNSWGDSGGWVDGWVHAVTAGGGYMRWQVKVGRWVTKKNSGRVHVWMHEQTNGGRWGDVWVHQVKST